MWPPRRIVATVPIEHRHSPDMSATSSTVSSDLSDALTPSHGKGAGGRRRRGKTHAAFWVMTRRVTVLAASVDTVFLVFFLLADSPLLAWLNVLSIGMYAAAYTLLLRRRNLAALLLIWFEVVAHAAIGTLLVGWDSGFHYYLLMFIPAIVVSGSGRRVTVPLIVLFLFYLALHLAAHATGTLAPIGDTSLQILNVFNVSIFFAMASYTARFYFELVRKSERKLRDLATRDTLTGLSNRRHLIELALAEMASARHAGHSVALVLADIDDFKRINDAHGHEAGDLVLIHASAAFREACRAQDSIARWGGEEFLFLLPRTGSDEALLFAERVRARIAGMSIDHDGSAMAFTLSLGVATWAADEGLEDAISRADNALYQSKSGGRNRVTLASSRDAEASCAPFAALQPVG
jgi:diguanylate cyclase (GGDEF)-like protein